MKNKKRVFVFVICLFLFLCLAVCGLFLSGCKNSLEKIVANNMSEITEDYYFCENDDFSLSLSVGKREKIYMMDGFSGKLVDFSLLVFKDKSGKIKSDEISATLVVDGKQTECKLQYNPVADRYMFDLGYKIAKNSILSFVFAEKTENLTLASQNFAVSCKQAIKIASNHFQDVLSGLKSNGKLFGECYLKIMGNGQNGLFWAFTIVTQEGENFNLIISVNDGKIVASD